MHQKELTGANLKIYINGVPFGIATRVSWSINPNRRPIYGLDKSTPFELAPSTQSITGTMSVLRLRKDGGLIGRGIVASDRNLEREKYINIVIVDKATDSIVLKIDDAAVGNQNWEVGAKGILEGSFEWEGLEYTDESSQGHG